jgi:flagellar biosynthetic protein FlhB
MSDSGERTEQPTAKRLKDAREKGQVAKSPSLVAALSLVATTLALGWLGTSAMQRMETRLADGLMSLADVSRLPLDSKTLGSIILGDIWQLVVIVGPLLLVAAVGAVAGNLAQTGWVVASERPMIDFENLSPSRGLARLSPSKSLPELLKALLGGSIIAVLAYLAILAILEDGPRLAWMAPAAAATEAWAHVRTLLWRSGLALVALGAADFGLQFWQHRQSLMMTRQEVKEEYRQQEGSPELKARIRRIQREMNNRRMMAAVKTATVIVTNPTHFAVALEYRRDRNSAPVVVAKGKDALAQKIKAVAREAGVPQVENVPLAQALYRTTEVGDVIPSDLFGAVAEVLAYLVRIRQLML